jgi:tRNA(Ile)-lysidine synthase
LIKDAARVRQTDLLVLSPPRQRNLLRHLIARLGLPTPAARQLEALLKGLKVQRADAETQVQWPGGEARIYRGVLYLFPPLGEGSGGGYVGEISLSRTWTGPEGSLSLARGTGPGLPDSWVEEGLAVRFRVGGERFRPLLHDHSRPLKKWLQDAGVLPWLRGRIPLLYHNDQLVAVGDLWISAAVSGLPDSEPGWQISWTNHPQLS